VDPTSALLIQWLMVRNVCLLIRERAWCVSV